jgi:serine/threonine protein phosphatase PrpC
VSEVGEMTGVSSSPVNVSVFGLSDVGRVRKNNEDNFVVCNLTTGEIGLTPALRNHRVGPAGSLLMVADGMGGEASGEVASQICTVTVPKRLYDQLKSREGASEADFVSFLRESIEFANQTIFQKAQSDPNCRGMGTTTTAAALLGSRLYVAQVGDSRAYLIRNEQMTQLTRDQTFLNYLKDIGAEMPEEPEKDSRRSILTQAVGSGESVDVKVTYTQVHVGDRVLLCSDGLYNMVEFPEILAIAGGEGSLADRCKALIEKANANGGTDNVTVVLFELTGEGLPPADPAAQVDLREFGEGNSPRR